MYSPKCRNKVTLHFLLALDMIRKQQHMYEIVRKTYNRFKLRPVKLNVKPRNKTKVALNSLERRWFGNV